VELRDTLDDLREVVAGTALLCDLAEEADRPKAALSESATSTKAINNVRIKKSAENPEQFQCMPIRRRFRVPAKVRLRPIMGWSKAGLVLDACRRECSAGS